MNFLTYVMAGAMYKVWAISLLCYVISCGCIYITEANTWLYCCDCTLVSCLLRCCIPSSVLRLHCLRIQFLSYLSNIRSQASNIKNYAVARFSCGIVVAVMRISSILHHSSKSDRRKILLNQDHDKYQAAYRQVPSLYNLC